jgi:hypothetical protein
LRQELAQTLFDFPLATEDQVLRALHPYLGATSGQ